MGEHVVVALCHGYCPKGRHTHPLWRSPVESSRATASLIRNEHRISLSAEDFKIIGYNKGAH